MEARAGHQVGPSPPPTVAADGGPFDEMLLWRRYRQHAEPAAREALLALHVPYARVVAATYYGRRFHDEIEFGDYLQLASIGLLEAMDRFDPDRGAQFRTFAARRMHGAILNGLERLTEKQQQISARQRVRAERTEALKELAAQRMGGAREAAPPRGAERLMKYVAEVGIGLALLWLLEGTSMVDDPGRAENVPFYRTTEVRQLRERLLAMVDALPPQERTVVRSHYLQDMPFEQVATMLNLTKGRISQIHKQALLHLRAGVSGPGDLDVSF
jgi:RNA polymerase sigma factor for flagellar operon FliA